MFTRIGISLAGSLVAAVLMTGVQVRAANDNLPEGAEVLGRGPVHEAFAQPLALAQVGPVAPKAPPEPIEEQPPEQRPEGDNVQWVPGYWQWDDERGEFLWVSGLWRNPPPNRKWVPGTWQQTENGFQFSNGFWTPENSDSLQYLPEPPATVDEGPSVAAPAEDAVYVPGLWVYRDARYLWRPGYWLRCRPGWVWQPAYYISTPAGYLYVAGCWDYPLESRGILFAPVCFNGGFYPRVWTPQLAVNLDFLSGALFVRSGYGSYYYGDYFSAGYRRGGFTPWADYSIGRHAHDPLFGYYRAMNPGGFWERDVRNLYADRFAGRAARPPRNLAQQNTVNRTNLTNVKNVTVLRPLAQSAPAQSRLVTVDRAEQQRIRQRAAQVHSVGVQRVKIERERIVHRGAAPQTFLRRNTFDLPKVERRIEAPKTFTPQHVNKPPVKFEMPKPAPTLKHTAPHPAPKLQHVAPPAPKLQHFTPSPKLHQAAPVPKVQHFTPAPQPRHVAPPPRHVAPPPRHTVTSKPAAVHAKPAPAHARPVQHNKPHR